MSTKKQQEKFQCVLRHPPLLHLTPVGFSPSMGTTTRTADPPPRPSFESPRPQRPFPNCFSLGFGPLSVGETTGCSSKGACFYRIHFCSFRFWWVCSWIFHLMFLRALMLPGLHRMREKKLLLAHLGFAVQSTAGSCPSLNDATEPQQSLHGLKTQYCLQ